MEDKKKVLNEADLIAFLDGHMSGGGGALKPKFEDGKMVDAQEVKLFSDGLEEACPTCANIPNMMAVQADNERMRSCFEGEEDE